MRVAPDTTRFAEPVLVTVMACVAETVPTLAVAKVSDAGETVAAGADAEPVPLRVTAEGEPAALWAMLTEADFAPALVGVNVTPMVQEAAGATGAAQPLVVANWLALAPVRVTPETRRLAVPVLLTVMACDAEVVPTPCVPNVSEAGATATIGPAGAPVPVRPTMSGDPMALLAIERLAVFAPTVAGVKVTSMPQLALMTTVAQVVPATANEAASVPVTVIPDTMRLAVPVLVRVSVWIAEVVVIAWLAKVSDAAEADAVGPVTGSEETRTGAARRSHAPRTTALGTSQKLSCSMFHSVSMPSVTAPPATAELSVTVTLPLALRTIA